MLSPPTNPQHPIFRYPAYKISHHNHTSPFSEAPFRCTYTGKHHQISGSIVMKHPERIIIGNAFRFAGNDVNLAHLSANKSYWI
jgi:hypothetical protein